MQIPPWLIPLIQAELPGCAGHYAAQLLWDRGLRDPNEIRGFLNPDCYQPTSPEAFGPEIEAAIARLITAYERHESVTIWGDFDADGVTATAVLWEGLGQFFSEGQLQYWIPNRLTDSHGLNEAGVRAIAAQGVSLVVTCDTGSGNQAELELAQDLGLDVIITDHHTLPMNRPPVVAIINPRYFPTRHPLADLSGVAVAYKLVEALYSALPAVPHQPLTELLDLVAIGLIADLVTLRGDGRYLAQRGIQVLQSRLDHPTRPGVSELLQLCKRQGDRPTDIAFGIGPRINAVSRIHGDAHACVTLLTSRDLKVCKQLAIDTEIANTRRRDLQKRIKTEVEAQLKALDLSTTDVIVLADSQWPLGILGIVAGDIARTYRRPTLLLQIESPNGDPDHPEAIARGSARSIAGLDLYELLASQRHQLIRLGGHPQAAGLSLPASRLPVFSQALNQACRLLRSERAIAPEPAWDLCVTVQELGQGLFRELKLLEPYGMGNPAPRLLIHNAWVGQARHRNMTDLRGKRVQYLRTHFRLWDETVANPSMGNKPDTGFPGIWWGHSQSDLPHDRCDLIVELDYNTYTRQYEVRLLDWLAQSASERTSPSSSPTLQILDWRAPTADPAAGTAIAAGAQPLTVNQCPRNWDEWGHWVHQARQQGQPLAIAFPTEPPPPPETIWTTLVGIAKYLARTGEERELGAIAQRLWLDPVTLKQGFPVLARLGLQVLPTRKGWIRVQSVQSSADIQSPTQALQGFLRAIQEDQFQLRYFQQIPVETLVASLDSR
jgi:single-stranded-DNA-specific exonuclease